MVSFNPDLGTFIPFFNMTHEVTNSGVSDPGVLNGEDSLVNLFVGFVCPGVNIPSV